MNIHRSVISIAAFASVLAMLCGCSEAMSAPPETGASGTPSNAPSVADSPGTYTLSPDGSPPETPHTKAEDSSMTVRVHVFNAEGKLVGPVPVQKVVKTEAEWRAQLSPKQYEITRDKGTEPRFCGTLLDNKKDGVYTCVCCNLPLFESKSKFNSGTGWPSFFQSIAQENVAEHRDTSYGMVRTEILCARCDAHLGHVFEDGPRPTGLRYCLNSESLNFTNITDVKQLADPAAEENASMKNDAMKPNSTYAHAVLAGGCFWCVEAVFEELAGVIEVTSGYAGGSAETADYKTVCTGTTGHAEVVQITYDPAKIDYEKLLEVFFGTHDPTTLNQQGNDVGTQYRSAIFFESDEQKEIAKAYIDDLNEAKVFKGPIVTTLEPLKKFFPAEQYHQNYVCNNPNQSYVRSAALPKVAKVRSKFKDMLKPKSPLEKAIP